MFTLYPLDAYSVLTSILLTFNVQVYSLAEEEDILLRNFSFTSPHTMLVSQNTGCVALVDTRTNKFVLFWKV